MGLVDIYLARYPDVFLYQHLSHTFKIANMAQLENSTSNVISARGRALEPKVPVFFDVLNNLWDPESNPDGIVNLGLAENVRSYL